MSPTSYEFDSAGQLKRENTQGMDMKTAMIALQIPRAERKTYLKIFAAREKNKMKL